MTIMEGRKEVYNESFNLINKPPSWERFVNIFTKEHFRLFNIVCGIVYLIPDASSQTHKRAVLKKICAKKQTCLASRIADEFKSNMVKCSLDT